MNLNKLAIEIRHINRQNGWNVTEVDDWQDTYKVPAILALIHSEVSEALEAFRRDDLPNFGEELADIIIRVLDAAPGLGIDIEVALQHKLACNRKRGHRHGGKRV